jgi:transcriptional regulator with XRE-family HTH domain
MSTTGNKVKIAREKVNLTEAQMASFLKISTDEFAKCETGEKEFRVDLVERICDLFGYGLDGLLNEEKPIENLDFAAINNGLTAVADINRIALNIKEMKNLLNI